jgi:hypothetical protein
MSDERQTRVLSAEIFTYQFIVHHSSFIIAFAPLSLAQNVVMYGDS